MSKNNTLLLYESSLSGHRSHYLRVLIPRLAAEGYTVVVTLPATAGQQPEFAGALADLGQFCRWDFSIPSHPSAGWRNGWIRLRALIAAIKRHRPVAAFVPTGDVLVYFMGFAWLEYGHSAVRRARVVMGLHRLKFGYPLAGLRSRVFRLAAWLALALSPVARYLSVDDIPVEAEKKRGWRGLSRLSWLPDPLTSVQPIGQLEARRRLGLPAHGKLIGVVGMIDERKGVQHLVPHMGRLFATVPSVAILLAGMQSRGIHDLLEPLRSAPETKGRLFELDRYLSQQELIGCVEALDLVCVFQTGHIGISSLLLRADQLRVPVLTADEGWSGQKVRQHHLGWAVDVSNAAEFGGKLVAIASTLGSEDHPRPKGALADVNTAEEFVRVILGAIVGAPTR